MTLIERIQDAIQTDAADYEAESEWMTDWYQQASVAEQKAIDRVFIHMCGWSLRTLIDGEATASYNPFLDEAGVYL